MNDTVVLGRLLRSIRSLTGRTQAEAAQLVGIHRNSLHLAERGVRPLSPRSYVALLAGLLADDVGAPIAGRRDGRP